MKISELEVGDPVSYIYGGTQYQNWIYLIIEINKGIARVQKVSPSKQDVTGIFEISKWKHPCNFYKWP